MFSNFEKVNGVDVSLMGSFTWYKSENMEAFRRAAGVKGLTWTKETKTSMAVSADGEVFTQTYTLPNGKVFR